MMSIQTFSLKHSGEDNLSPNFKVKEFRCKDGSDKILIDVDFVRDKLQKIRDFAGKITVTSGYRTNTYNRKVGGAIHSYHVKGQAFDIVPHDKTLDEVCRYAESIGILGIIKYPDSGFVHVDSRTSKYFSNNSGKSSCNTFGRLDNPIPAPTPVPIRQVQQQQTSSGINWSALHTPAEASTRPRLKGSAHLYDYQNALTADGIPTSPDGIWGTETATNTGKVSIQPGEIGRYPNIVTWCQCRWNFTGSSLDGQYGIKESVPACNYTRRRHGLPETGVLDGSVIISILRDVGVPI